MVMGPKAQLQKVGDFLLQVDDCSISPFHEVRNLGVILDSTLSYQSHIKTVTKSAFFRPSLSDSVVETLIHALISLRLNYCRSVLFRLPNKACDRLQYIQNSAARGLTRTRHWQHITPTVKRLQWLPVKFCITYKLGPGPTVPARPSQGSLPITEPEILSDLGLLTILTRNKQTLGDRAFRGHLHE